MADGEQHETETHGTRDHGDAEEAFATGVRARGEAVDDIDDLPPGTTHVVVGVDADGCPVLERRRFSIT